MAQSVTRALQAIKRYDARPEQIDHTILAAINVTLCLTSRGDDRVAEGFNNDIAASGRSFFVQAIDYRCRVARQVMRLEQVGMP